MATQYEGSKTTELTQLGLIDEVLGNRTSGSDKGTGRIPVSDFANQLLGSGPVAGEFAAVRSEMTTNALVAATWAVLVTIAGTIDAQGAEVLDTDAGTHLAATSTGYNGAAVPNSGRYSWNAGWSRWVRIGATGLTGKADKTQTLTGAGLATTSGNLGAAPTVTVPVASNAEAIAGIVTTKAMTPANNKAVLNDRVGPIEAVVQKDGPDVSFNLTSGGLIDPTETVSARIAEDPAGYAPAVVLGDGTVVIAKLRVSTIEFGRKGGTTMSGEDSNYDLAITDADDNVGFGIAAGNELGGPTTEIAAADLANRLAATQLQATAVAGLQQPTADFNTVLGYGQSLMVGQETWPAHSKTQRYGNLMLGGDIRPTAADSGTFVQYTPTGLQPLIAKVTSGGAILSDASVAALSAGDQAYGENPIVGMLNAASWLLSRRMMTAPKPFVGIVPAVSAKTIEQLSKVNGQDSTDRYNRFLQGLTQAHTAATTGANAGKTHVVTAIVYFGNEYDYDTTHGSTKATLALFKTALALLRTNMIADVKSITGQSEDPAFILYQTGGAFTRDVDQTGAAGLHVGMAQLQFAAENPTKVFLAAPTYPVTDKGGHLDSNGSRWTAEQLAKIYHRTVIEGRRWRATSPIRVELESEMSILVHFHVPVPPLQWADVYVVNTATMYAARGFRVTDSSGTVPIASADIVGQTIVRLSLDQPIGASPRVWYAGSNNYAGSGNLCDSDPHQSLTAYEYAAGTGQYASANIAALVAKPYPCQNWSTAFYLPVPYSE